MTSTQTIELKQTTYGVPPVVHAVQNDTGRRLKMVVADEIVPNGSTAELSIRRSDGSYYNIQCEQDEDDDQAFVCDMTQALTQAGKTECQLKVAGIVSTYLFILDVQKDVYSGGEVVEQLGYNVQDIINAAKVIDMNNNAKSLLRSILEKSTYMQKGMMKFIDAFEYELSHGESVVFWAISSTLKKVLIDNPIESVADGEPYTATITADEFCTIYEVRVLMGGFDITISAYDDGTITIPQVTGIVSIVASADVLMPEGYTKYDYVVNNYKGGGSQTNNGIMVNTGLNSNPYCLMEYSHEMVFSATSISDSSSTCLWGTRNGTGAANYPNARLVFINAGSPSGLNGQQNNGAWGQRLGLNEGQIYKLKTVEDKVYLDDNLAIEGIGDGDYTPATNKQIHLYGEHRDIKQAVRVFASIRSFIVRDANDIAVAALFPCVRESDSVAGFYDVVRNAFYPPTSTTSLTAGNDE